ncbi:hypothetical protein ACOSQ4_002939 [Xanthoceras sorbifolium]
MGKIGVVVAIMLLFLVESAWSLSMEPPPVPAPEWPRWRPSLDPKVKKCLSDVPGLEDCHPIILHTYLKPNVANIKAKCCKAMRKLDEDCSAILFDRYNNPFFQLTLKEHCSNDAAAPAPKA